MLLLFTDFGASDIYVGQVKAVLAAKAPDVPVIDLMNDAPPFNVKAGAHLLAALAARIPRGSVTLAVVDPGVGSERRAVAVSADGRWFVAPDNGLLSVLGARAARVGVFDIGWTPERMSASFHGRDLFAPVAAMLLRGRRKAAKLRKRSQLAVRFGAGDLAEIVYVDHYGNLMTGMRASAVPRERTLRLNGRKIGYARVYSKVPEGRVFWYENSLGLVEFAANSASAREVLAAAPGNRVT